ncbi:MAG: DUF1559 domain-containing protein [Planctomycetaceae bacterium]|nr:DUF1559 domain-containing protein [Planctomycetaceae bacterium]
MSVALLLAAITGCTQEPQTMKSGTDPEDAANGTMRAPSLPGEDLANAPSTPMNVPVAETAAAPAEPVSPLEFVPADAVAAIQFRPASVLNNPLLQDFFRMVEGIDPTVKVADGFVEFEQKMGVSPYQIEQVVIAVQPEALASLPMIVGGAVPSPDGAGPVDPGKQPLPVVVVRLIPGVGTESILGAVPDSQPVEIAGKKGVTTPSSGVLLSVDESTVLFADPAKVEGLLSSSGTGDIGDRLTASAARDLTVVLSFSSAKELIPRNNPVAMMLGPLIDNVQTIDLTADLSAENLVQLQLVNGSDQGAQTVQNSLNGFLNMGKAQYSQAKENLPPGVVELTDQMVNGAALTVDASTVSLALPRPAGLEKLPELLRPTIEQARATAQNAVRRNNLKQVALAFHNFASTFNRLPAVDSNGAEEDAGIEGKGLSWRVHLLPFYDFSGLYEEFRLDEPWDSEHNKALISRMPLIFGNDPEGKTSIHVFVGEGLAFEEGKPGPKFLNVTDGLSFTVLAVEAGPDTADYWTKPGGLALNPENPFAALGTIGESFLVVLFDGSVREIPADLPAETLVNLVKHNDGQIVELP